MLFRSVGGTPVDVGVGLQVEHVPVGERGLGEVAAGRVHDALGRPGRARGVQDEQEIPAIHHLGCALSHAAILREAEAAGLPADWPSFRAYYARIRKAGYYFSNGELEPELAALAVPLLSAEGETLASLSVVAHVRRMAVIDLNKLTQLLQRSARALIDRLD